MNNSKNWFIRNSPNVIVLVLGLVAVFMSGSLSVYVEDEIIGRKLVPERWDAILYDIYCLPQWATVEIVIFFIGCGISLAAIWRMLRPWMRPK